MYYDCQGPLYPAEILKNSDFFIVNEQLNHGGITPHNYSFVFIFLLSSSVLNWEKYAYLLSLGKYLMSYIKTIFSGRRFEQWTIILFFFVFLKII